MRSVYVVVRSNGAAGAPQPFWFMVANGMTNSCQSAPTRMSLPKWSPQRVVSAGGDNYFPFIAADRRTGAIEEAWYTHRFDPVFHNRQDVELVRLSPNGAVLHRTRVTPISNETEADPILHGAFIGDYFQIDPNAGRVYVHYNANFRQVPLVGEGIPIPQQDNFLAVRSE